MSLAFELDARDGPMHELSVHSKGCRRMRQLDGFEDTTVGREEHPKGSVSMRAGVALEGCPVADLQTFEFEVFAAPVERNGAVHRELFLCGLLIEARLHMVKFPGCEDLGPD